MVKRKNKGQDSAVADEDGGAGFRAHARKGKNRRIGDEDEDLKGASIAEAIDLDVGKAKEEAKEKAKAAHEAALEQAEAEIEEEAPDPYLLADATYIKKDTRWRNKQRTLVFTSRGVTPTMRHLCDDLRQIMPHHKVEPKFEKSSSLHEINEVCELKSCNNVIFLEARKHVDLYMWVARVPSGPTLKFQVLNIHTTGEVRLAGNCLLGSRPLLHFDKNFEQISFLKLVKTLFTQVFGTPRNHPKSKPFHDHILGFYWMDKKIWFRHYQIAPETPADSNDPEKQQLTEIGPRFVLDPIRFLSGSFGGQTLFASAFYMSPTALRSQAKRLLGNPYRRRKEDQARRAERMQDTIMDKDPLEEAFE